MKMIDKSIKKNNVLEFYRLLFCILIAIMHFHEDYSKVIPNNGDCFMYLGGAWVGVDFFFILSGFFLYKHFEQVKKEENISPFEKSVKYIWGRIKTLWPEYVLSLLVMSAINVLLADNRWQMAKSMFIEKSPQYFFLHSLNIPTTGGNIMRSIWYIPPMLLIGYLIYFCLQRDNDTYLGLVATVGNFFLIIYVMNTKGNLAMHTNLFPEDGWLTGGVVRAFMDMNIGVLSFVVAEKIRNIELNSRTRGFIGLLEMFALVRIFLIMHQGAYSVRAFCVLLYFPVIIITAWCQMGVMSKFCNWRIFGIIGQFSYSIYLISLPISALFVAFLPYKTWWKVVLLYCVCVAISAFGLRNFAKLIFYVKREQKL